MIYLLARLRLAPAHGRLPPLLLVHLPPLYLPCLTPPLSILALLRLPIRLCLDLAYGRCPLLLTHRHTFSLVCVLPSPMTIPTYTLPRRILALGLLRLIRPYASCPRSRPTSYTPTPFSSTPLRTFQPRLSPYAFLLCILVIFYLPVASPPACSPLFSYLLAHLRLALAYGRITYIVWYLPLRHSPVQSCLIPVQHSLSPLHRGVHRHSTVSQLCARLPLVSSKCALPSLLVFSFSFP